jgi:hypothetical protein
LELYQTRSRRPKRSVCWLWYRLLGPLSSVDRDRFVLLLRRWQPLYCFRFLSYRSYAPGSNPLRDDYGSEQFLYCYSSLACLKAEKPKTLVSKGDHKFGHFSNFPSLVSCSSSSRPAHLRRSRLLSCSSHTMHPASRPHWLRSRCSVAFDRSEGKGDWATFP